MTKISIQSPGGGGGTPLPAGNLQIKNGLAIDATLQTVSDQSGNDSALNISTESVGIGTTTATGLLNLYKSAAAVRLMINGDSGQNRLITYRTGGVQRIGLYLNNTAETGSNVGSDFAIRRYTDAGTLGGTPLFIKRSTGNVGINTLTPATTLDVNGTANIAERLTIEADSTATTQSTAVIQNTTANSGIALVPNGTGAITADIPDGTATGGNARGANAVDLQSSRSLSSQVASGVNSTIIGGFNNISSGINSITGGRQNTANNDNAVSFGQNNNSTGTESFTVGLQNTASGRNAVALGLTNTASGRNSFAVGQSSIASSEQAVALGGSTASGANSTALSSGRALQTFSVATGSSISYLRGMMVHAGGNMGPQDATAQASFLVPFRQVELTSGQTALISLDGTGVTAPIQLNVLQERRVFNVTIKTIVTILSTTGTTTGVLQGEVFMQNVSILAKVIPPNIATIIDQGVDRTFAEGGMITANMTYTTSTSNLNISFVAPIFVGGGTITVRVVSKVELVETAWGN
jgi:hypothetical protein